ncbi:aldo/keto reductase [Paludifilum halophilum]|uniref:General stress protein n=1 Tax=Paludifilum halophilum TaxID=1642702 RepID=A0A235B1N4_9BACL|nr:aldo/keto reductase [Paludifilum halophilum]OYD06193.1 general stress protein [Paludifilum halophilum]
MEKAQLGNSNLQVTRIGLGTWAMGGWMWGGTDEQEAIKGIRHAIDMGMTLIDTAPVYGFGVSEEIVSRAVQESGKRDQVVLATKAGLEWDNQQRVWRNSRRERLEKELEDSLRRLKTDVIDLYQIHWPDPETPIEETAETLNRFYEQGKIRAIGVSNYNEEQMAAWQKAAPLHSNQPQLNLFQDSLKDTVFPYCDQHEVGTLTWGTLAHGLLSGKFDENTTFPEDDLRHNHPMFQGERFKQYLGAVKDLKELAAEKGKSVLQLSVRWVLQQPGVTTALWGARRPQQLEEVPGVFGWELSTEDLERIETILRKNITNPAPQGIDGPPSRSAVK